ncbi:hypothetical protein, partial [Streptococcus pneumoniae]|uniref:hypothetical protein n=1 Tax=Streptococcus pneumoniae TaxID=1313 RepID=UPI001E356C27
QEPSHQRAESPDGCPIIFFHRVAVILHLLLRLPKHPLQPVGSPGAIQEGFEGSIRPELALLHT